MFYLNNRINLFLALPLSELDEMTLHDGLKKLGQSLDGQRFRRSNNRILENRPFSMRHGQLLRLPLFRNRMRQAPTTLLLL